MIQQLDEAVTCKTHKIDLKGNNAMEDSKDLVSFDLLLMKFFWGK